MEDDRNLVPTGTSKKVAQLFIVKKLGSNSVSLQGYNTMNGDTLPVQWDKQRNNQTGGLVLAPKGQLPDKWTVELLGNETIAFKFADGTYLGVVFNEDNEVLPKLASTKEVSTWIFEGM